MFMTGANGGADGSRSGWRWDVALSFAGAQRGYVKQVAEALKARGLSCFYDADEEIELWGKYLAEELPTIYGEQAATVVVFVSADYAARDWTRAERRAALTRAVRERREYVLPARFDDTPLPGLLSDMVTVDLRTRTPQQFAAMVFDKLASLTIGASAPPVNARDPAQAVELAHPAGAVRAGEVDPRRLGVHAAIRVPGESDEIPPKYVPRDVDAGAFGVRAKVAAAAKRGGFVLLVGGSSVGKTRCAVEALAALPPDWWLVHPAGPAEVAALAEAPAPRTVVWLDELQRYLDGEHGLTGGVVRALLNAPHQAVLLGTLWPDRYTAYTTPPAPGGADPHAREREVLDLAEVVRIDPAFSTAERGRARTAAVGDLRLRIALDAVGYGLTQTLAAAPQLVARWEDAKTINPYAWAVLTAALDAALLGARAPLSIDLLRSAAVGYCTDVQQAEAPGNWFEQALAYATVKLHGAVAALSPAGAMGQVAGYTVADYLIQHASRERRYARVPASTWDAVISHIRDPADTARLADSARSRLLYGYAIPLYQHATDAGNADAADLLANLLVERGDLDGAAQILRARANAGDRDAARRLAGLMVERGDFDALRARADAGDGLAAVRLVGLLAQRGDLDGLRARANAGDEDASVLLADLLAERGDFDGPHRHCAHWPTPATRLPPGGWPACWPNAATLTGPHRYCAHWPTPATRLPPGGWPACWPSTATPTGPHRYCAPKPTSATGMPPCCWPACWPSARTSTRCAPALTPATRMPPGGWPTCWPSAATSMGCAPGPTPATCLPPGGWPACWPSTATSTGPRRFCASGPTPATCLPPGSWPACWPSTATSTGPRRFCASGPTPATGLRSCCWPACWPSTATTGPHRHCAHWPTPATGLLPGGWPACWPSAATLTGCAPGPTPATGLLPRG